MYQQVETEMKNLAIRKSAWNLQEIFTPQQWYRLHRIL
jgi:hypothetical protein